MKRCHMVLRVSGRVQGVWYRRWTRREARSLGLVGYVRNNKDGTVSVEAQGTEERLRMLETRCWKGSMMSRVMDISVQYMPIDDIYKEFIIKK